MQYAIHEDFFPDVEKKLNRIAKKCVKHGNPFTFEIAGSEIRSIYDEELGDNDSDYMIQRNEAQTPHGLLCKYREFADNNEKTGYIAVDTITFTVKGHTEYKGVKQTEISRPKFTYHPVEIETK